MGFGILIVAIAAADMSAVVIHTVDTLKVLSCFTRCTNHPRNAKKRGDLSFFYVSVLDFASLKQTVCQIHVSLRIKFFGKSFIDVNQIYRMKVSV